MSAQKMEIHYRLTNDEWVEICHTLKGAEIKVLMHLRTLNPWGDQPIHVGVSEIARTLGCAKGTVSKALQSLAAKQWITLEIHSATVRLYSKGDRPKFDDAEGVSPRKQGFPQETIVSPRKQGFPQETIVSPRKQLEGETLTEKGFHPLSNIHTLNKLQTQEVCVLKNGFSDTEVRQEKDSSTETLDESKSHNQKSEITVINPREDQFSAAPDLADLPILQPAKKLGVNLGDRALKAVIEQYPDRVPRAIQCLEEKQLTVKSPTRYLCAAIEGDWRPEKAVVVVSSDWREWFDEARNRGLVVASEAREGVINVLSRDGQWLPYEQLRRLGWDELQVRLNPAFSNETIHGQVLEVNASPVDASSKPKTILSQRIMAIALPRTGV